MQQVNGLAIAVSNSSSNCGGCQVWVSTDGGSSYNQLGSVLLQPAMGFLTAVYPSHANPDTSNTLSVNLTESNGELQSFTSAQQNQLNSIALSGRRRYRLSVRLYNEHPLRDVAYGTVTLTGSHAYNCTEPILRGQLGTVPAAHDSGGSINFNTFVDLLRA